MMRSAIHSLAKGHKEICQEGTFRLTLEIGDPEGQRYEAVEALVDTGASYTMVPASLLRRLGVPPHPSSFFILPGGYQREIEVGRTWLRVDGKAEISLVIFGLEDAEPLPGAHTLQALLLAADPVNERLVSVPGLLMAHLLRVSPR